MALPKYLAIINPAAKSGKIVGLLPEIKQKLGELDVTYRETSRAGEAVDFATNSADYDVVIAIGGDGTVHEIANGIMQLAEKDRPGVAVIPCGSGNDTCRMIGSPLEIGPAIESIKRAQMRPFDLGVCNGSYFVNSFSVGIDALTVAKTTQIKRETSRSGMMLYGQALIDIILNEMKPNNITVTVDGKVFGRQVLLHAITNGQTYGSGFKINPTACAEDGTLTSSYIEWMGRMRVLGYIPRLLRGTHTQIDKYHTQEITSCTITSQDDTFLIAQADGELIEKERTFSIEVRPHALRFVV